MLKQGEIESASHLPCAGITLIRFYGYDLSLALSETPRETLKT